MFTEPWLAVMDGPVAASAGVSAPAAVSAAAAAATEKAASRQRRNTALLISISPSAAPGLGSRGHAAGGRSVRQLDYIKAAVHAVPSSSTRRWSGPENDQERQEAAQDQTVAMRPGESVTVGGEPQARVSTEQFFERNSGFEPGQGRAQAVVDPVAEPEVRPVAAADVEDVGCREP